MESVLQRLTIIGEILSFRALLHSALHDILERRLPFLLSAVKDLHDTSNEHNRLVSFIAAQFELPFCERDLLNFVCITISLGIVE